MADASSPLDVTSIPALSARERYSRQTIFSPIGAAGQERLERARVLIVGCGALGTVLANNLARAGVGFLRIVDRDFVEGNNLQRQVLFDERDAALGLPKAIAAAERIHAMNHLVQIDPRTVDVTADNVEELIEDVDLVMDGTDNFETRYLLNDACLKAGKPWIYSGVLAAHGVTMVIQPGETACLRCVFPDRPLPGTTPTCETAGVLNTIVGVVGGFSSTEALKLLIGADNVTQGLTWIDVWEHTFDHIELPRQPECPACGLGEYEFLDAPISESGTSLCGRNAVQVRPPAGTAAAIDLSELAERLRATTPVDSNGYLLRFSIDGHEITVFPDARAIIKGTADTGVARSLYARYVGM